MNWAGMATKPFQSVLAVIELVITISSFATKHSALVSIKLFILLTDSKSLVEVLMRSLFDIGVGLKRISKAWRWLFLTTLIFSLSLSPSLGQGNPAPQVSSNNPASANSQTFTLNTGDDTASVSRGTSIKVTGNSPIEDIKPGSSIQLELYGRDKSERLSTTPNIEKSSKTFEFILSEDLVLGAYSPRLLVVDAEDQTVKSIAVHVANSKNNMLTINSQAGSLQPVITSISPSKVIFPAQSHSAPKQERTYSFNVFGNGFSPIHSDNHLVFYSVNNDERDQAFTLLAEPEICWKDKANKPIPPCQNKSVIGRLASSRQLFFENLTFDEYANDVKGELGIAIRVGDNYSNVYKITVSRVAYYTPLWWAVFGLFLVAAIVLAILGNSRKGKLPPSLLSLIIDPETKTYSLSGFQFVLWTVVAILSYLFLFLSKSLAQGKPEFIDIPSGLPAIVLASAATSFFAIGINNTKGGKASGPETQPVWSDLICAGGSVLPDRLQFLAWTLVGVFVYMFTVLSQNPGVISDLPVIPPGFLQLSGVSAVGYLGGKLVRSPGPVITSIDKTTYKEGFLTLVLNGKNLSKDASLVMTDFYKTTIRIPQEIGLAIGIQDNDKTKAVIQIIDMQPGDSTMASKLKIQIPSSLDQWQSREDPYSIALINPDTQIAAWKFDGPLTTPAPSGGTEPGQGGEQGGSAGRAGPGAQAS